MTAWIARFVIVAFSLLASAGVISGAQDRSPTGESIARLLRSGDAAGALKLIDGALVHAPRNAQLRTLRGLALTRMGRADEALDAYRAALALHPDYLPALQGAAQIEYGAGRPEARRTLERIVAVDGDNMVAHAMLAALAYDRQDCATALAHFRRADDALRGNARALWQLAHCLFVSNRPAEAAERFQQVLDAGALDASSAAPVVFNLALSLHAARQHQRAIAALEPLGSGRSPEPDVLALLADAYAADAQVERAIATLRRAVSLYPRDEQFYIALGALCLEHESFELGREVTEIGLRNVPEPGRLYALRGIIHAQLGAFEQAQADFERVAQIDSQHRAAAAGLSLTLQQTGQIEQSLEILREQVRLRPDDDAINLLFAQSLLRGAPGDAALAEARQALLRAAAVAPARAAIRTELGKLYLKTGEPEQAIEQLQKAVALDPSDKTPTYHLLIALRRAGRQAEAQTLVVRMRELLEDEKAAEIARNRFRLVKAAPGRSAQ